MIKRITTYNFDANLEFESGKIDEVPFQVLATNIYRAKQKLLEYLENEGHQDSGYKYKQCVGITEMPSRNVLIDSEDLSEIFRQ